MRARGASRKKGALSKERLLRRVGRMCAEMEREKGFREEALERDVREARLEVREATAAVRLCAGAKGTAEFARARARKQAAEERLAMLRRKQDPRTEMEELDRMFSEQKRAAHDEHQGRRARLLRATRAAHRKRVLALGRHAQHPHHWRTEQPKDDPIRRELVPLGQSDPSLLAIPWHRDDFRLPPGKPDFKAVPGGESFIPPPSPPPERAAKLGGPGRKPCALDRSPAPRKIDPDAAHHEESWRPPSRSDGRPFARYAHWRPPTEHEARRAAAFSRPDRLSYDPRRDGKAKWRESDPVGGLFSTFAREDEVIAEMEAKQAAKIAASLARITGEDTGDDDPAAAGGMSASMAGSIASGSIGGSLPGGSLPSGSVISGSVAGAAAQGAAPAKPPKLAATSTTAPRIPRPALRAARRLKMI